MRATEQTPRLTTPGAERIGVVPLFWEQPSEQLDSVHARVNMVLDEIRRLGIETAEVLPWVFGVELGKAEGWDVVRDGLAQRGMRASGCYWSLPCDPVAGTPDGLAAHGTAAARAVAGIGGRVLVVGLDFDDERVALAGRAGVSRGGLSDDAWSRLGATLREVGARAEQEGVALAFHNHAGTFVESPAECRRLFEETDGDARVGFCLDTGQYLVAEGDLLEAVETFAAHLRHVHVKDVDPEQLAALRDGRVEGLGAAEERRLFTEVGMGALELDRLLAGLTAHGYDGLLMLEQETSWLQPTESIAASSRVLARALQHR